MNRVWKSLSALPHVLFAANLDVLANCLSFTAPYLLLHFSPLLGGSGFFSLLVLGRMMLPALPNGMEPAAADEESSEPLLLLQDQRSRSNTTSQVAIIGSDLCPIESLDYEYAIFAGFVFFFGKFAQAPPVCFYFCCVYNVRVVCFDVCACCVGIGELLWL
ncbi:UNVERIFIED_CONTAM: hypothetical protein Slati_2894300 [Sesamum latifolium]|uniref:Uncharacterized protein n=1 Tax=Sesamum latifolium TaxID=2727402 RepID=A0AAW2VBS2_9LAMI